MLAVISRLPSSPLTSRARAGRAGTRGLNREELGEIRRIVLQVLGSGLADHPSLRQRDRVRGLQEDHRGGGRQDLVDRAGVHQLNQGPRTPQPLTVRAEW